MAKAEHSAGSFKLLNPSGALPVLVVIDSDGETVLTQSIPILEYLEETGSQDQMALLPPAARPKDRAKVRELVGIIAADLFPPANSRVARLVRGIRDELKDQVDFVRQTMSTGFASYESMIQGCSGRYSFKDAVTMADVCLVPAVDMAQAYELDLTPYPRTWLSMRS
jgi:maleylacetoacetate isomerase